MTIPPTRALVAVLHSFLNYALTLFYNMQIWKLLLAVFSIVPIACALPIDRRPRNVMVEHASSTSVETDLNTGGPLHDALPPSLDDDDLFLDEDDVFMDDDDLILEIRDPTCFVCKSAGPGAHGGKVSRHVVCDTGRVHVAHSGCANSLRNRRCPDPVGECTGTPRRKPKPVVPVDPNERCFVCKKVGGGEHGGLVNVAFGCDRNGRHMVHGYCFPRPSRSKNKKVPKCEDANCPGNRVFMKAHAVRAALPQAGPSMRAVTPNLPNPNLGEARDQTSSGTHHSSNPPGQLQVPWQDPERSAPSFPSSQSSAYSLTHPYQPMQQTYPNPPNHGFNANPGPQYPHPNVSPSMPLGVYEAPPQQYGMHQTYRNTANDGLNANPGPQYPHGLSAAQLHGGPEFQVGGSSMQQPNPSSSHRLPSYDSLSGKCLVCSKETKELSLCPNGEGHYVHHVCANYWRSIDPERCPAGGYCKEAAQIDMD
ncbi:hypothetical protein DACRYDRAFT_112753 [Dacryopinax primogenitus]|uniref:Uncharacterized protein n=1 Tax=Dacryopinax primogenitus (strain DJM 731) TaxID=1858805 RepID=M5FT64_DACPD|nr:uncharacterized protein DACRYDRAFT_112753 [Dacryopinax primogenitus]EJT96451.1 hypothetical protein DACRYDRAFT_112753 [Dacryopinax primogenitus]